MVIDTNVIRTADGLATQAGPTCVDECASRLEEASRSIVHMDNRGAILTEYLGQVAGEPPYKVGTRFVHHLLRNQANTDRCSLASITPHPEREWAEFPDDHRLTNFDRDDRKFVAVALASDPIPDIVNAVDSDWALVEEALADHGISVIQLCP